MEAEFVLAVKSIVKLDALRQELVDVNCYIRNEQLRNDLKIRTVIE